MHWFVTGDGHGWTQDRRTWDRVVDLLPKDVRRVRYDLRGHGESAPAERGTATIDRLADELGTGRLVLYPDAGHMLPQERAHDVAEHITALCRSRRCDRVVTG